MFIKVSSTACGGVCGQPCVCETVGVTKCRATFAVEGHMFALRGRGPVVAAAKCLSRVCGQV